MLNFKIYAIEEFVGEITIERFQRLWNHRSRKADIAFADAA